MSVTINSIITNLNTLIGDTSTDRVSNEERYEYITEATAWLLEELGNEHMVETYELDYFDTINYYKVTGSIPDLLTSADLRRESDNYYSFARKSPRELSEEIAQKVTEPSWATERRDSELFLVVNAQPRNIAQVVSNLDSITDGGTWTVDATTSDATNLTTDTYTKKQGTGSINFDVDVSQSGNNRATIYANDVANSNLEQFVDTGSFVFEMYIPDATYVSSITLSWGSDADATPATKSNYWTATVTTDIDGEDLATGWNTIKVDWNTSTMSGAPDETSLTYNEITLNYTASQTDDTDFRIDYLRAVKPEKLVFHYISWNVGTVSAADITPITAFTAITNVPFFSGQYDQYKYAVAHKAASLAFSSLRLREESTDEDNKAEQSLTRYRKNFAASKTPEVKSFKLMGNNLRRRSKSGRIR